MHFIWPCSRLVRLLMPPIEAICWEFLGREAALLFHHSIGGTVLGRKSTLSIQSLCASNPGFLFSCCRLPFLQIHRTPRSPCHFTVCWKQCKRRSTNVITVSKIFPVNSIPVPEKIQFTPNRIMGSRDQI